MSELTLQATAIARQTIAHHSKSFALASAMLGARVRDQTSVVYTWCRRADDAIDLAPAGRDLGAVVAELRGELDQIYAGTARGPVLEAFSEVVRARRIPRNYPEALLAGMAMDASDASYATLDDLLLYCWRVAGVVGLMMTHVFGVADDRALVRAAHLGIAMQLTNVCRDVAEDWQRGRLYLPTVMLDAHGCRLRPGEPLASAVPAIGEVVGDLLAVADRYYRSGDRGVHALPWRAALAVRSARGVYSAIGDRIVAAGCDVTAGRAIVSRPRKLAKVARAAGGVALSFPSRWLRAVRGRGPRIPTTELDRADV